MTSRRTVTVVIEQPTYKRDKTRMHAYGVRAIATVAKCSARTVERAVDAGALDMGSMVSVLMWVGNRKQQTSSETRRGGTSESTTRRSEKLPP